MKQSRLKQLLLVAPAVMIGSAGLAGLDQSSALAQTNQKGRVASKALSNQKQEKGTVRFNFSNAKWETVIKWFADQADLALFPKHGYPEGTYTLNDGKQYTVSEALDQLNYRLQLNGFLLIKRNSELIVIDANKGFEESLIEHVEPSELMSRGKFELLVCTFDISGLEADDVDAQIKELIDNERGKVTTIAVAKTITVREFGNKLRMIHSLIETAKDAKRRTSKRVKLKYVNYETVMRLARPNFGMEDGEDFVSDKSLVVMPDRSEKIFWVSGTKEKLKQFMELVTSMDTEENTIATEEIQPLKAAVFPIDKDADLIQKVISDEFAGTSEVSNMNYSEETEQLYVKGTDKAIKFIQQLLVNVKNNSGLTVEIFTNHKEPEDVIDLIKQGLGLESDVSSASGTSGGNDPIFIERTLRSFLVTGTPGDVRRVQELAEKIDPAPKEVEGESKGYETISLNDRQINSVLGNLETIWKANGSGALHIRMPKDRVDPFSSGGSSLFRNPAYDRQFGAGAFQKQLNAKEMTTEEMLQLIETLRSQVDKMHKKEKKEKKGSQPEKKLKSDGITYHSSRRYYATSKGIVGTFQEAEEAKQEKSQDDPLKDFGPDDVVIERTTTGIIILSKNPANIRKVRRIIDDLTLGESLNTESTDKPITFYLQFRKAEEMKTELEDLLQLSSSGGGGGNAISNMVGRAAGPLGGMVAGALGGGGSSVSSSSDMTQGDVYIHADGKMNSLIIYAGPEDIENIDYLITMKDRSAPPHNPTVTGESRVVSVKNRDVEELKQYLDEQFKEYLPAATPNPAAAAGGGRGGNPLQALRNLTGGKQKKPAAKPSLIITADISGKSMIISGPDHLADQVVSMIKKLDSDDLVEPTTTALIALPPGVTTDTVEALFANAAASQPGGSSRQGANRNTNRNAGRGGSTGRPTGFNFGNLRGLNFGTGNRGGSTRGGNTRGGSRGGSTRGGSSRGGRGGR